MPVTLVPETGAGLDNANTYATVVQANTYHEASLYAQKWLDATPQRREMALVYATRLIDSQFQFNGYKRRQEQALQWPRRLCPDPDSDSYTTWALYGGAYANPSSTAYLPEDKLPKAVIDATCEMAAQLLAKDRVADPREGAAASGIKELELAEAIRLEFNTSDAANLYVPQPITRDMIDLLSKYGRAVSSTGGTVRLRRV